MQDWQQRVVNEKAELDVKRKALTAFLRSEKAVLLDTQDTKLLLAQSRAMVRYSMCLGARIKRFK